MQYKYLIQLVPNGSFWGYDYPINAIRAIKEREELNSKLGITKSTVTILYLVTPLGVEYPHYEIISLSKFLLQENINPHGCHNCFDLVEINSGICQECCEHDDIDHYICMNCGYELDPGLFSEPELYGYDR